MKPPRTVPLPLQHARGLHRGVSAEWVYYVLQDSTPDPYNFYHETDAWIFKLMLDAIRALAETCPCRSCKEGHNELQAHTQIYPAG
jgi:hypothetical protein